MIDIYSTISRLQKEREEQKKVPAHVELSALLTEVTKETRRELNRLYQEGKVGTCETINGRAVYVKEEKSI